MWGVVVGEKSPLHSLARLLVRSPVYNNHRISYSAAGVMISAGQSLRSGVILLFSGWIAYTCFKRAVRPPKDRHSFGYNEVEAFNRNPIVRTFNILAGLLVLAIGVDMVYKW